MPAKLLKTSERVTAHVIAADAGERRCRTGQLRTLRLLTARFRARPARQQDGHALEADHPSWPLPSFKNRARLKLPLDGPSVGGFPTAA
jgi:hypothetical protein